MPLPRTYCLLAVALIAPPVAAQEVKPVATFVGHTSPVAALAFVGDGRIVSVCANDVRTWDAATGKEAVALKGTGGRVAAISANGKLLAVGIRTGRGAALDFLGILDGGTGKERYRLESYADWDRTTMYRPTVNALAYSPDGFRLASAGGMGGKWIAEGVVTVWDATTGKVLHCFDKLPTSASSVTFSSDGSLVAATTIGTGGELPRGGEVHVWDAVRGKRLHTLVAKKPDYGEFVSSTDVAFSPDGKRIAASVSGDSRGQAAGLIVPEGPVFIVIWDAATGKELLKITGHTNEIARIAFSPDGKQLAAAGKDRVVRVWNSTTGKVVASYPFDVALIDVLAFSPDGKHLAAAGVEARKPSGIRVWALSRE